MHLGTSYHLEQLNDDEVAETEDPPDIVETSSTSSEGFWAANDPADPSDGDAAHKNISHKSSLSLFLSAPCILQLLQRAKLVQNAPLSLSAAKNAHTASRPKRKAP